MKWEESDVARELAEEGLRLAGDLTIEAKLGNTKVAEFKLLSDVKDEDANRIGMRFYPVEGVNGYILLGVVLGVISEISNAESKLIKEYIGMEDDDDENSV